MEQDRKQDTRAKIELGALVMQAGLGQIDKDTLKTELEKLANKLGSKTPKP